jgi:hypothetical protein
MTPLLLAAAMLAGLTARTADTSTLYRIQLVRAAPGRLLEAIDLLKRRLPPMGVMLRHSQGDQWDLLVVSPLDADRLPRPDSRGDAVLASLVAWREDVYVAGPPAAQVATALASGTFYHVEMHCALPGRQAELRHEREMENAFERWLERPQDLIFTRVEGGGAAWDVITIGTFRDLKHYAESADIPAARQDSAARAAGYESADAIGPFLRTLISSHHDTLARAVR